MRLRRDPRPTESRITGGELLSLLDGRTKTKSGRSVNEFNAVTMTAVFRSVALISGTVAGLPLKTYRSSEKTTETRVRVLERPNPVQTMFELKELQATHLALWGNSYTMKVRDRSGRVVELWQIMPDRITPKIQDGKKVFEIVGNNDEMIRTDAREILHIPGFGYDGVKGLSPVQAAKEAIGGGLAAEEFGNTIYNSGAMVGGLITTPRRLTSEQARGIKTRWRDTVGGIENAHDIGILDQGMKFEKMSMPPTDIQFLESRQFGVIEVARLYGVPPHLLMDVDRSTSWGTGIEEQTIGFVTFTIKPAYLQRMETRYTDEIVPAGQFAEFKIDGLLRGSSKDRADVYEKALDPATGWMNRDEVRDLENLPPDEDFEPEEPDTDPDPEPTEDEEPEVDVTDEELEEFSRNNERFSPHAMKERRVAVQTKEQKRHDEIVRTKNEARKSNRWRMTRS